MITCQPCNCKMLNIRLYNKHQRLNAVLPNLRIPCQCRKCNKMFTEHTNFTRHAYLQHSHENKVLFKCSFANCNLTANNRIHFNKNMKLHLSSSAHIIIYPFSKCKHNSIVFENANTYSVHVCRIHPTDEGIVSRQNKESEILNSWNAVMDVSVEPENEFQLLSNFSSNSEEVSVMMQVHVSDTPHATKTFAELCLNLTTHH